MSKATLSIHRLYISPGHNFFGRHGMEPAHHPTLAQEEVRCLTGRGIEGDRFCGASKNGRGQITFFDRAVFRALQAAVDAQEVDPGATRRNVIVEGLDLIALIGRTFRIGDVTFKGTEECRPCYWMDQAVGAGAHAYMKGRGGLRAKILTDGALRIGPVDWELLDQAATP